MHITNQIYYIFPDVKQEKTAQSLFAGIAAFDSTKLNHAETQEKNILPDKDGKFFLLVFFFLLLHVFIFVFFLFFWFRFENIKVVAAEKNHQNFLTGVEHFDKSSMKHTETTEKNALPPIEGLFFAYFFFCLYRVICSLFFKIIYLV